MIPTKFPLWFGRDLAKNGISLQNFDIWIDYRQIRVYQHFGSSINVSLHCDRHLRFSQESSEMLPQSRCLRVAHYLAKSVLGMGTTKSVIPVASPARVHDIRVPCMCFCKRADSADSVISPLQENIRKQTY